MSEIVNRACYGGERVTLSRNGKPVAAIVSLADLAALESLEDAADAAAYDEAKAADDGARHSLEEIRADHEALSAQDR